MKHFVQMNIKQITEGMGGIRQASIKREGPDSDLSAWEPQPSDRDSIVSVKFSEPNTPIRTVVSRSRMCSTGRFPSWKMDRMLEWESYDELNAFRLLDCDVSVRRFLEQPCEVVYKISGEVKRHYPDIYVEANREKQLWEVKDDVRASQADVVARTTLLTEALKAHGFTYRLVLGSELRVQPRLQNANILLRYGGRASVNEVERESVRLMLRDAGRLTWGAATAGVYGPRGRQILCRLTLEGVLLIDMNKPLSSSTTFGFGEGVR